MARTLVNTAINSFNASVPSLTPLLAVANTPPVLWIAEIMSDDSTANFAATAFIEPKADSSSVALIPNCLIRAMLPSTVLFMSSNEGAKALNAKAFNALSVSLALNPA